MLMYDRNHHNIVINLQLEVNKFKEKKRIMKQYFKKELNC